MPKSENTFGKKSNFPFEIYTIKKCIPQSWLDTNKNRSTRDIDIKTILSTTYQIPGFGNKKLVDLNSKDLYSMLLKSEDYDDSVIIQKSMSYWDKKFPCVDIDFDMWFDVIINNKYSPRKTLDFNWRILHGQINTENKLSYMNFSTGICTICRMENENVEHLLVTCNNLETIWKKINDIIVLFTKERLTHFNKIVGFLRDEDNFHIVNTVLSIVRWIIWKRRCLFKYDNKWLDEKGLWLWIKHEVQIHINLLLCGNVTDNKNVLLEFDNIFKA